MIEYAPIPMSQFFDDEGMPLVNGILKTFEAGTDTPLATFNAEGTQNEVEIKLNARGECCARLDTSKRYKFVLCYPDGSTVWTLDNIGAGSGSGGGSESIDVRGSEPDGTKVTESVDAFGNKVFTVVLSDAAKLAIFSAYRKPNTGIPLRDLANGVQNSLSRADNAVRFNHIQSLSAEEKARARGNIFAAKNRGDEFAYSMSSSQDSSTHYALIATRNDISKDYNYLYNYELIVEVTFHAGTHAEGDVEEHGIFKLSSTNFVNFAQYASIQKYNVEWLQYNKANIGGTISGGIVGVYVGVKSHDDASVEVPIIDSLSVYLMVDRSVRSDKDVFDINIISNVASREPNSGILTWELIDGFTITEGMNKTETSVPSFDSYKTFSVVHSPKLAILDTPNYTQADGDNAVKCGDLPVIVYEDGGGAVAWPIQVSDSGQHFSSINTNRSMSVFSGGLSGNIEYLARFSSTRFMTPTIDTTIVGQYIVGEDYLYPMDGQTHSISVYFEVVDPGSPVYNVMATWRRSGTDDPKKFKIAVTYFGNTVGCWHGTKTLSTTETALTITDFDNMVKLEIDFISTDEERWYHFEYVKEANRSRMVEY